MLMGKVVEHAATETMFVTPCHREIATTYRGVLRLTPMSPNCSFLCARHQLKIQNSSHERVDLRGYPGSRRRFLHGMPKQRGDSPRRIPGRSCAITCAKPCTLIISINPIISLLPFDCIWCATKSSPAHEAAEGLERAAGRFRGYAAIGDIVSYISRAATLFFNRRTRASAPRRTGPHRTPYRHLEQHSPRCLAAQKR